MNVPYCDDNETFIAEEHNTYSMHSVGACRWLDDVFCRRANPSRIAAHFSSTSPALPVHFWRHAATTSAPDVDSICDGRSTDEARRTGHDARRMASARPPATPMRRLRDRSSTRSDWPWRRPIGYRAGPRSVLLRAGNEPLYLTCNVMGSALMNMFRICKDFDAKGIDLYRC